MSSNTAPSRTMAYAWLTLAAGLCVLMAALAILYGLILLWIIGALAALAGLRFGVMPLVSMGTDMFIKLREHNTRMQQFSRFALIEADENGNYSQVLDTRTGQVIYLRPGNPGVPMQIAGPRQRYDYDIVEAEQVPELEDPAVIDVDAIKAPSLAEELRGGLLRAGDSPSYGHKIVTDPFTGQVTLEVIDRLHEATAFLVGFSGAGKSAFIAGCMTRRVAATNGQVAFLVVDPHKGNPDKSICAKIRPALDDWIYQPRNGQKVTGLQDEKALEAVCDFLESERALRLERDDLTIDQKRKLSPVGLLPIWLIVDEALAFARSARVKGGNSVYSRFTALLQSVATETAKAGVTGVFMSQLGAKKQLGDFEIRDVCPQQLILRTPADQAETLGLTAAEGKIAAKFPQGRGYVMGSDGGEPSVFVWGYAAPEDIAEAVKGLQSPLIPEWKQGGNRIIDLSARGENRLQHSPDFYSGKTEEIGRKVDMENRYPAALQAALEAIPDWENKLDTLRGIIGADQAEIWQALFNRAPGGRNHAALKQEYDVLAEAVRYEYRQLRKA